MSGRGRVGRAHRPACLVAAVLGAGLAPWARAQPALYPDRELSGTPALEDVAYSSDGRLLAAVSSAGTLEVWDAPAGLRLRQVQVSRKALRRVAVAPPGNVVGAAGEDGGVYLLDLRSGGLVTAARHPRPVTALAFSPDGLLAASGDAEGRILLWDPSNRTLVGTLDAPGDAAAVRQLAWSAPATLLALDAELQLSTWDVTRRLLVRHASLRPATAGAAALLTAAGLESGGARFVVALQQRGLAPGGELVARGAPARPGDLQRSNLLVPYAVETGLMGEPIHTGTVLADRLALAPDGCDAFLSSSSRRDHVLAAWDLLGGNSALRLELPERATALALDPAGRQLALALASGRLRTFRVSGAGAGDCRARRAAAQPKPAAGPRFALGGETGPLIPDAAEYRVAVLRFEAGGVEPHVAETVADMIAGELSNHPRLHLAERREIDAIVRELEIQRSGLTAADAARIGRGLNARKVFLGSLSRLQGDTFVILVRMVDVETQRVEGTRQLACEGCAEKDLPAAVSALRAALVR